MAQARGNHLSSGRTQAHEHIYITLEFSFDRLMARGTEKLNKGKVCTFCSDGSAYHVIGKSNP